MFTASEEAQQRTSNQAFFFSRIFGSFIFVKSKFSSEKMGERRDS